MSRRSFRLYLNEIIESALAIQDYVQGYSLEEYSHDRKTYSAVIREFEIIGEATSKLPNKIKEQYPEVPWRDIKDFRNFLTHEYFGVDLEIVWQVIHYELPLLLKAVKDLANKEVNEQ